MDTDQRTTWNLWPVRDYGKRRERVLPCTVHEEARRRGRICQVRTQEAISCLDRPQAQTDYPFYLLFYTHVVQIVGSSHHRNRGSFGLVSIPLHVTGYARSGLNRPLNRHFL